MKQLSAYQEAIASDLACEMVEFAHKYFCEQWCEGCDREECTGNVYDERCPRWSIEEDLNDTAYILAEKLAKWCILGEQL